MVVLAALLLWSWKISLEADENPMVFVAWIPRRPDGEETRHLSLVIQVIY